jgi:hypothetical protein
MDTQNIDSEIKKVIDGSADYYNIEAAKAKERIWKQVQAQKQRYPKLLIVRSLVAACILLFIITSVMSISLINAKKSMKALVESNSILIDKSTANNQKNLIKENAAIPAKVNSTDTIYVERKEIVSKPIELRKQVIDTVYIKQIVYIEKEPTPESLAANVNSITANPTFQETSTNYNTEVLISNNESNKGRKGKRIQIKFGGNKDQLNNGTLAFTTKF